MSTNKEAVRSRGCGQAGRDLLWRPEQPRQEGVRQLSSIRSLVGLRGQPPIECDGNAPHQLDMQVLRDLLVEHALLATRVHGLLAPRPGGPLEIGA